MNLSLRAVRSVRGVYVQSACAECVCAVSARKSVRVVRHASLVVVDDRDLPEYCFAVPEIFAEDGSGTGRPG